MKKLYWRPSKVSRIELLLIALVAVTSIAVVENLPRVVRQPYYGDKIGAARLTIECQQAIKDEKIARGITIDPEADPAGTGLIGSSITKITSNTGHLPAKITSTNPNFAAVVVHLLRRAGVEEGSVVAVGLSGSFPALNVAVYAAMQTMKVEPLIIVSAAASEWGATDVNYTWLDMEQTLAQQGLISFRAIAASRGGVDDRGFGIAKEGRALLDEAIERAGVPRIEPKSLADSIDKRMTVYYEHADDKPVAAYINVGGGSASVGTAVGKRLFKPGLNRSAPKGSTDSVMYRFVSDGVPVIHFSGIKSLAERFGLPLEPNEPQPAGEGGVYTKTEYNPWFALMGIVATLATMFALLKLDLSHALALPGHATPSIPPSQPPPPKDSRPPAKSKRRDTSSDEDEEV